MSRFFVPAENVGEGTIIIDKPEDIKHIARVLRLKEGDEIDISDGMEWEYKTRISMIEDGRSGGDPKVMLDILDKQKFAREPSVDVTLFQGIPKQGKMETIIQKCVELGIKKIVPVFMKRTVVVDNGKFSKKIERWQKISAEAVKQCRRGIVPEVSEAVDTAEMIRLFNSFDHVIFPYENEDDSTIKDCLKSIGKDGASGQKIAVVIGPEGGFSEDEAEDITAAGAYPVSLGKTILRTETAGMAAVAMIMYELEL